jgi:hypothetical protein
LVGSEGCMLKWMGIDSGSVESPMRNVEEEGVLSLSNANPVPGLNHFIPIFSFKCFVGVGHDLRHNDMTRRHIKPRCHGMFLSVHERKTDSGLTRMAKIQFRETLQILSLRPILYITSYYTTRH